MSPNNAPKYVGPEIRSVIGGDSSIDSSRVTILARPEGSRDILVRDLEKHGAIGVEQIASESVRAQVHRNDLEELLKTSSLKAIEIERPVVAFDQGN